MIDFIQYFDQMVDWAGSGGGPWVWSIIGLVLLLSGVGLPLPEDIPLTLAGFLTYQSGFFGRAPVDGGQLGFSLGDYSLTMLFCCAAILAGDVICWWLGRRFGLPIRERVKLFRRLLTDKRLAKVTGWFDKYGSAAVFLGRQMAGVRFVTFFSAGVVRMRLARFVFWDFVGCLVSVPIWFTIGGLAAEHRDQLRALLQSAGNWMLLGVALLIVLAFLWFRFRRKRAEADEPATPPAA